MATRSLIVLIVLAVLAGGGGWYAYMRFTPSAAAQYKTPEEAANVYVRFDMEAFDTIMAQYWQSGKESDLASLYQLALAKVENTNETLPSDDRAGVAQMLAAAFAGKSDTDQHDEALNVLQVVLYNLAPTGRDQLMTGQQEQSFRNHVANINPAQDLYATLGLQEGASTSSVQQAYQQKIAELQASTSPQAKQQLADVRHAHTILSNATDKQLYDQTGMQPSISMRVVGAHTLYVDLSKVTPASFAEFVAELQQKAADPALTGMILDLRGNIGGTFDFLQNFLALFIGPNEYAFDLYSKGQMQPQRTTNVAKLDVLSRFSNIALLTDGMTQSTAELTTAVFERYHLARVIGATTRGWGSVENTYPLTTTIDASSTYALLLVNSLTLDENNQPIEGNGVKPDVDVGQGGWQAKVRALFPPDLAQAVIGEFSTTTK